LSSIDKLVEGHPGQERYRKVGEFSISSCFFTGTRLPVYCLLETVTIYRGGPSTFKAGESLHMKDAAKLFIPYRQFLPGLISFIPIYLSIS
jgi:hypothetical protein